jgi:translation initiation factor SUI1
MDLDFNTKTSLDLGAITKSKITIRVVRYSARRAITLIEGLDDDLDLNRICKYMKRFFNTNGCVLEEKVIQLQGDFKEESKEWLITQEVLTESEAKERVVLKGT